MKYVRPARDLWDLGHVLDLGELNGLRIDGRQPDVHHGLSQFWAWPALLQSVVHRK
jgi:hypothetical protein